VSGAHERITSAHNPAFRAALAAGVGPVELWVDAEGSDEARRLARDVAAGGGRVVETTDALVRRLAYGDRDDRLVLVARTPAARLDDLAIADDALVGILERVEKPGNLGAVLRSADGAGVDALIVADLATDLWNPNAIRASIGTIFTVPVAQATADETLAWLGARRTRIVTARVDGATDYTQADLRGSVAIALGSEADGLSAAWDGEDVTSVHVPMLGVADSLNVSVTAALLFYEARRQRGVPRGSGRPAAS
jgi:RNA methyltransferase, TrmH family